MEKLIDREQIAGMNIHYLIDGNPYGHLIWGDGNHDLGEFLEAVSRHGYQGYLGQEITEFDHSQDPASADARNMEAYAPFIR